MKPLKEDILLAKGWSKEEISEAKKIFEQAPKHKQSRTIFFEKLTYWLFFGIIIIGGIGSAWIMEPLLLVLSAKGALLMSGSFGILFGALLSFVVKDIEKIQSHHHIIIVILIFITTISTSTILARNLSKTLKNVPELMNHNPYLISIFFSLGTIIIYGFFMVYRWKKYGSL